MHFVVVMIRFTGLAPWEFESPCPGSLTSTFLRGYPGAVSQSIWADQFGETGFFPALKATNVYRTRSMPSENRGLTSREAELGSSRPQS